jgi:hypothetical protein
MSLPPGRPPGKDGFQPSKNGNMGLFQDIARGLKRPRPDATNRFQNHKLTIEQTIEKDESSEWKTIPLPKKKRKKTCFGCEYGLVDPDETNPALKGLAKLFSENFGKTSNACLASMMRAFWVHEIQKPMKEQGETIEDWTEEEILEHIETHIVEPTIINVNQIRNLQKIEEILVSQVTLENTEGNKKIDLKVLKGVLDVQKQIQSLLNAKCTRQLLYSNTFKLDESRKNNEK